MQSDDNTVINNFAESNLKGIRVEGDNNNITGNETNDNKDENFQIKGNNNRLVNNPANGGDEECFLIEGNNNSLVNNSARDCEDGFLLSDEDGGGDNNRILNCNAVGNRADGIVAGSGAIDNRITNNNVFENGSFDLEDENLDCNNNVWKRNKFFSSEPVERPP